MTTQPRCHHCGHVNRPGARFCAQCGHALDATGTPDPPDPGVNRRPLIEARRWRRRPGEIAVRIRPQDLPGLFGKEIIVEEGTTVAILEDGKATRYDGPGRYALQTATGRLWGREVGAVLLDGGEIHLDFELTDLWTRDPLRLWGRCEVAVQIADPAAFIRNVLKDKDTATLHDLRAFLFPELAHTVRSFVADHTVPQLDQALADRPDDLAVDLQERLQAAFAQSGLAFRRVRLFDLAHPRYDELRRKQEDLYLGPQELETRKRLADLYNQEQLQQLAEEEADVARFEMRAQIWQRMRQAVLQDKITAATGDEEWEQFVAELDKRKLLREDELARFREQLRHAAEDRARERAHLLALADLYAEYELKAARLSEQFKHDRQRLQNELELARQETLGRLELRRKQVEMELEIQALEAQHRRTQQELDDIARRERVIQDAIAEHQVALQHAQTELERARIQVQIERLEDDNDLLTVEKAQAMMRRNKEEKLRIQREHEIAMMKAQLEAEERRLEMRLREQAQARQHELARMKQMSEMSVEALIAFTTGPEQAAILGELKRTELLRDFTEEQILAMAVEKRPEVVQAFQAKFQALAEGRLSAAEAEKWRALAELVQKHQEDLYRQMQDQLDRQERQAREAAERQERITGEALRQMGDVAKAFAQKPDGAPNIIFGPGSGGYTAVDGAGASPAGGRVQVCPNCRVEAPVGEKYCANCGHAFYQ